MDLYLMTGEVARILGRSPECVRIYVRAGKLPAVVTANGRRLFRGAHVRKLAKALSRAQGARRAPAPDPADQAPTGK